MPSITRSTGLATGIDSKAIIDQLMALEAQSKTTLQNRVSTTTNQKSAYDTLLKGVSAIRSTALKLQLPTTFRSSTATSSNENVLSATTTSGATVGSFNFRVARLVTAQQSVSTGFADFNTQRVGAGTLTVEMGGGEVNTQTNLADLNGGAGVSRGAFRITDRSGASAVIDATAAVTLDDVVKKINSSTDIRIKAEVKDDKLILTDASGSTAQNLIVQDMGATTTAAGLGIATSAAGVASGTLTGTSIYKLSSTTALSKLNDGLGVRTNGGANEDMTITTRDGGSYNVTLGAARTIANVASEIDAATGGKVKLVINTDGDGFTLTDTSSGGGSFSVAAMNGSKAAADLGIIGSTTGATLNGAGVFGSLNTVLLKTLNGGLGLALGELKITDRSGIAATIDLSTASTVQDVIDTINATSTGGFSVKASVKDSGNGIQLIDTSGGGEALVIEDVSNATATKLGLNGTFTNTTPVAVGSNLQRQWINENTTLASLNGGKGITPGIMKVTNSRGDVTTIDLTNAGHTNLGQVIKAINDKTSATGVTVGLNAQGDGLLVTDSAGGANKLKIEDSSGSMAANLNIRGQATGTTIDGSYEKTITVSATDTLTEVTRKLTDLSFGVSANVVNDGSGASPYRLSLTAMNSGTNGRVVFDAGTTSLGTRKLVDAQDAAVFIGGGDTTEPLLVTGSSNQLTGVLPGVNIDLHSASDQAVSLSVTRSSDDLVKEISGYVDGFNELIAGIETLTAWDSKTQQRGLLMGDAAVRDVESTLYAALNGVVSGAGKFRTLSDVGLRLGEGAVLEFDEEKFRSAYAEDATAVEKLFTAVDRVTTTTVTTGGILVNGISADGSVLNNVITGGTAVTTTTTNGPVIADGVTTTGGTSTTDGALTTTTGAVITQNKTTSTGRGFGYLIERALTRLTDPVNGILTQTTKNIDQKISSFQDRIASLDKNLEAKRARLEKQFANMETVIAKLQSQQSALNSFTPITYSVPAA
jgi:flagellar hook-associated protein 2